MHFCLNENKWISIKISLKFVPKHAKGPINHIPALVRIMTWRRPGAKPLSEPMVFSLLAHMYATRHQWVKQRPLPHGIRELNLQASITQQDFATNIFSCATLWKADVTCCFDRFRARWSRREGADKDDAVKNTEKQISLCWRTVCGYRLFHSPSLVAVADCQWAETWSLIGWHHPFASVWTKYMDWDCLNRDGLLAHVTGWNFHRF